MSTVGWVVGLGTHVPVLAHATTLQYSLEAHAFLFVGLHEGPPLVPLLPLVPDVPLLPEVPLVPDEPLAPEVPLVPEVPLAPELPLVPLLPEVPLVPDEPLLVPDEPLPKRSVSVAPPHAATIPPLMTRQEPMSQKDFKVASRAKST
ncbi:MAG: hypothetical protein JWP97_2574 [Labilithrix sp.]|nr:hypothetical protein [Labilithrix sp.]